MLLMRTTLITFMFTCLSCSGPSLSHAYAEAPSNFCNSVENELIFIRTIHTETEMKMKIGLARLAGAEKIMLATEGILNNDPLSDYFQGLEDVNISALSNSINSTQALHNLIKMENLKFKDVDLELERSVAAGVNRSKENLVSAIGNSTVLTEILRLRKDMFPILFALAEKHNFPNSSENEKSFLNAIRTPDTIKESNWALEKDLLRFTKLSAFSLSHLPAVKEIQKDIIDFLKAPQDDKLHDQLVEKITIDLRNQIALEYLDAICRKLPNKSMPVVVVFGGRHVDGFKEAIPNLKTIGIKSTDIKRSFTEQELMMKALEYVRSRVD